MHHRSEAYLEDLSDSDVEQLSHLLKLREITPTPSNFWLHDRAHLITGLPPILRRPSSSIERLFSKFPWTPPRAILCPAHSDLNAQLIRHIFLQVTAEVTNRVERLSQRMEMLPQAVQKFVGRMHTVNTLWMGEDTFVATFNPDPELSRFPKIESCCEACILSVIGANPLLLADLRASILSRRRRTSPLPPLLRLVESWAKWTNLDKEIRLDSDARAKEIRRYRRQIQRERRQSRNPRRLTRDSNRGRSQKVEDQRVTIHIALDENSCFDSSSSTMVDKSPQTPITTCEEEDLEESKLDHARGERDENDLENSIISLYLDRWSSRYLSRCSMQRADVLSNIHPAFRSKVPSSRTSFHHSRNATESSVYSGDYTEYCPPRAYWKEPEEGSRHQGAQRHVELSQSHRVQSIYVQFDDDTALRAQSYTNLLEPHPKETVNQGGQSYYNPVEISSNDSTNYMNDNSAASQDYLEPSRFNNRESVKEKARSRMTQWGHLFIHCGR